MAGNGRTERLPSAIADWLGRFQGDVTCALQAWYEGLDGMGTPDPGEVAAIEEILASARGWEPAGNARYEKMGVQRSFRRMPLDYSGAPENSGTPENAAGAEHLMVQHLFRLNSLQRAPDGRVFKVVVSEVYNLRCFEIVEGAMVGGMVKIHPLSDLAKSLIEI